MMTLVLTITTVLLLLLIVPLMVLYSQLDRYASYWNQRNQQIAQEGELLYVALGDSTAQAVGASSPGRGYVGLIGRALQKQSGQQVRTVNLSKSGARLADCLEDQLPRLKTYEPDVVTIEIGANDMGNFDETVFRREMKDIMTQLPDHTVISDMPYFGGGRKRAWEPNAQKASAIIHELAAERRLRVAPLHQITKERNSIFVNSADLFHPSNRGYRNWFGAFWSVLQKN